MKKKILIIGIILVIIVGLLLIPRSTYQKWFGKTPVDTSTDYEFYQVVYVKNTKNQLVGLKIGVDAIEEDTIKQKWDLLTEEANKLPQGYSSPITSTTLLEEHTENNGILTLVVSSDFIDSDGRKTIECLAWTFCDDEINEIVIKIGNKKVTEVGDFKFTKINKDIGVNFIFETNYLFEAEVFTVIFNENDYTYPVTYFFDQMDACDYMLKKVLASLEINQIDYNYELEQAGLVINLDYEGQLTDKMIKDLVATVKYNFQVDSLTVNGSTAIIYEQTFKEVEE